jgi:hypothetical protein
VKKPDSEPAHAPDTAEQSVARLGGFLLFVFSGILSDAPDKKKMFADAARDVLTAPFPDDVEIERPEPAAAPTVDAPPSPCTRCALDRGTYCARTPCLCACHYVPPIEER